MHTHGDRGGSINFGRGFPWVVDPRRRGLGAQPSDADEVLICKTMKIPIFKGLRCININYHYVHLYRYMIC